MTGNLSGARILPVARYLRLICRRYLVDKAGGRRS